MKQKFTKIPAVVDGLRVDVDANATAIGINGTAITVLQSDVAGALGSIGTLNVTVEELQINKADKSALIILDSAVSGSVFIDSTETSNLVQLPALTKSGNKILLSAQILQVHDASPATGIRYRLKKNGVLVRLQSITVFADGSVRTHTINAVSDYTIGDIFSLTAELTDVPPNAAEFRECLLTGIALDGSV